VSTPSNSVAYHVQLLSGVKNFTMTLASSLPSLAYNFGKSSLIFFVNNVILVTPIFKTFLDALNFNHLALCPSLALDIRDNRFREELTNHLRLNRAKREGVAHHAVYRCELVVARVVGVTLHLKGDI